MTQPDKCFQLTARYVTLHKAPLLFDFNVLTSPIFCVQTGPTEK